MRLFTIGRALTARDQQEKASDALRTEADNYKLASDGGYIQWVKYALFILFGYYNARLFVVTVPGWEGALTAAFALIGEATALYCLYNFTRSAGAHKKALGAFAFLLTTFSVTHATISFFRMEQRAELAQPLKVYCESVAFPLLFGLLLLAAIVIPLCHWQRRVAQEQAATQVQLAIGRARLVGEAAALKAENELERERLEFLREKIRLGNEYATELENLAVMKEREHAALDRIKNPEVRKEIELALGKTPVQPQKPVMVVHSGKPTKGNGLDDLGN